MSPRLGIFSQRSEPTKRSNAKVTVRSGTFASLLITLGGRGPLVVKCCRTRSALFGNLIKCRKDDHHHNVQLKFWFCIHVTSLVQNST